jgi:NitT/TauT family transport system permease protein
MATGRAPDLPAAEPGVRPGAEGLPAAEVDEQAEAGRGIAWPPGLGRWIAPIVSFVLMIALWQAVIVVAQLPVFVLPPPGAVFNAFITNVPLLLGNTWVTLVETLAGFALSIVVAVPLAIVISSSPVLRNGLYPFLLIGQSVPKQAVAPLLLLWIGYGEGPKVLLAFLTAFFPIVVSTAVGLQMTPPEMLDLGRLLSASRWRVFTKVTFPSAMPYFFAGLKVAISLAIVGAVIGEFIGADKGLGHRILVSTANAQTALAFAAIGMLSLLGIALFGLICLAERVLCPWYDKG